MTVSVVRYDFISLILCLLSLPFVQVLSLYFREPVLSSRRILRVALFGGVRHLIFTLVSWFLWIISVLFATPVVSPSLLRVQPVHVSVLYGAAVALSVLSLFLNIKALFVFDRPRQSLHYRKQSQNPLISFMGPETGFITVLILGLILSCMSAAFINITESLPDTPSKLLYCSISVLCSMIAVSTTHGLGGYLRHGRNQKSQTPWKFFQPFVGGRIFIATQALGWSLFSLSLVFFIKVVQQIIKGVAFAIQLWALASGGAVVVTQLVLAVSLLTFKPGCSSLWVPYLKQRVLENLPVLLMYTPVHLMCTLWVLTFSLLPKIPVFSFWTVVLSSYYLISNKGNPKHTGCRRWPEFQQFIGPYIEKSLSLWFGGVQVVNSTGEKLDPKRKYIYGYHPHGMYPVGAGFLQALPQFRKKICKVTPTSLSASAVFFPPLLRDLLCWYGVREVSRSTFVKALNEDGSVLLCPGGQEELVESYRATRQPQEIVFCSRHKGFCRLAIEQGAALVPVLSLGEIFSLRNAFNIPSFQKLTYKKIGFPIPYWLVGRWAVSPFPKRVPLMYIVGEPIPPPKIQPEDPNYEAELNAFHQRFFTALLELFEKHKKDHPFYEKTIAVLQ
eukprot:g3281.t1